MIISSVGEICDGFYMVGNPGAPVYLLDGEVPALFDAGISAAAFLYADSIREILGERHPGLICLTHSHFDHIGSVSHFKEIWPEMKVAASHKCAEVLKKPNAIKLMRMLSQEAAKAFQIMEGVQLNPAPFEPFAVDMEVAGDEEIPLGKDLHVRVISTPGHTWDFLSYWIPEKRVLIASEAVAVREDPDYLQPEFLVGIDAYLDSLAKLEKLNPEVVCAGHYHVFTGPDATEHIRGTIKSTKEYRQRAENYLSEVGLDVDQAVEKIKALEWDPRTGPKQPEPAYVINTRQRVLTVLAGMQQEK